MIDQAYTAGLSLMARPLFPGCVTLGALLVRVARELDPDEGRADRAWVAASAILDAHRGPRR